MMRTIWLASYPKSGNTWFRILLANLTADSRLPFDINNLRGGGSLGSERGPFDRLTLIDSDLLTHDEIDSLRPLVYEQLAQGAMDEDDGSADVAPPARFVKTHDAYACTAKGEPLLAGRRGAEGAIVIVRDPRDVAPSLAHHKDCSIGDAITYLNNKSATLCGKTDRLLKQFRQYLPGWSGHIESWLGQSDIPVHLVRYEDMKADAAGTLGRALAFAQYDVSMDAIERAVRLADFTALQAQEREKGFREAPRPQRGGIFFRRGEAGAWRDELTADEVARIESEHAPMMRRLGYEPISSSKLACAG
jgi:aryl sulfotransferase